jgi:thiol-disulfide isomerase/thioredoxin
MSTSRRQTPRHSRNTTAWVVGAVVAVIAVIGLGVVLLAGSDDDGDGASGGDTVPADVEQYQPVTVTGAPLAPLDPELEADPAVGTTAPVVDGASFDGTPVTIGADGTDHTMVVVLAHWCPHCNAEIPRLIELQEQGRLPENLRIVGVSTSVASDAPNYPPSTWIVDKGWPWEVVADSESQQAAVAYGVSGFPFVTMYDPSGVVTARWSGESSVDELAERIDAAVAV